MKQARIHTPTYQERQPVIAMFDHSPEDEDAEKQVYPAVITKNSGSKKGTHEVRYLDEHPSKKYDTLQSDVYHPTDFLVETQLDKEESTCLQGVLAVSVSWPRDHTALGWLVTRYLLLDFTTGIWYTGPMSHPKNISQKCKTDKVKVPLMLDGQITTYEFDPNKSVWNIDGPSIRERSNGGEIFVIYITCFHSLAGSSYFLHPFLLSFLALGYSGMAKTSQESVIDESTNGTYSDKEAFTDRFHNKIATKDTVARLVKLILSMRLNNGEVDVGIVTKSLWSWLEQQPDPFKWSRCPIKNSTLQHWECTTGHLTNSTLYHSMTGLDFNDVKTNLGLGMIAALITNDVHSNDFLKDVVRQEFSGHANVNVNFIRDTLKATGKDMNNKNKNTSTDTNQLPKKVSSTASKQLHKKACTAQKRTKSKLSKSQDTGGTEPTSKRAR